MPTHRVDPAALEAAGRALAPLRERVADAEDDLLAQPVLAGDLTLQQTLDTWVDHAGDALRSIGDEAAEQALALRTVAVESASAESAVGRSVAGSVTRSVTEGGRLR